jgi:hypothetical protein
MPDLNLNKSEKLKQQLPLFENDEEIQKVRDSFIESAKNDLKKLLTKRINSEQSKAANEPKF